MHHYLSSESRLRMEAAPGRKNTIDTRVVRGWESDRIQGDMIVSDDDPDATMKVRGSLHGPYLSRSFQVWIHHVAEPEAMPVAGVTEHVPVPEEHPACAAVYQVWILVPVESLTHK